MNYAHIGVRNDWDCKCNYFDQNYCAFLVVRAPLLHCKATEGKGSIVKAVAYQNACIFVVFFPPRADMNKNMCSSLTIPCKEKHSLITTTE